MRAKGEKRARKFVYGGVAAAVVAVAAFAVAGVGVGRVSDAESLEEFAPERIRATLVREFEGFYEPAVEARGVTEVELVAAPGAVELVAGVETEVWSYNGVVPGPTIRMPLGNTLRIEFENRLPQETTIHFHGIRVPNAFDGVPGVTQPPIPPGGSFTYEFVPKDSGTYWYHPHANPSEQIERGLHGVIVVEDERPLPYTQDVVWVLDDWLLTEGAQVYPYFVTMRDLAHDGRWGGMITVNGRQDTELRARPGERVRVRLVNASNGRIYQLYFGGLRAMAVAVDGLYVGEAFSAHGFELAPGNRIDVDITIPADAREGRRFVVLDYFTQRTNALAAIVVGAGGGDAAAAEVAVATPQFDYPTNRNMPAWQIAQSLPVDALMVLDSRAGRSRGGGGGAGGGGMMGGGGMGGGMMSIEWVINGRAYPDYEPLELAHNTFNKVRYVNRSARLHPMHLHGQFFKVLSRNGTPVDEPFFRDTVLIHGREEIEIGIIPLDRGHWAHHCHILEHADSGMMGIVDVF